MVLRFDKKEIQSTKNNRHSEREVTANYCCTIRGCRFVPNAFQILMIFWLRDSVCVSISANRLSLRQSLFVTTAIPFELFLYWRLSHIEIISLNFRIRYASCFREQKSSAALAAFRSVLCVFFSYCLFVGIGCVSWCRWNSEHHFQFENQKCSRSNL